MGKTKDEIYQIAKMGGSVGFGKRPAIVVIDFQKGFTLPEAPGGGDMTDQVLNTAKLIQAAREKNVRVFYTRVGYNKDGSDLTSFGHKATILKEFTRDHWYYEWDDRLDIRDEDVLIEKHWPSAFFGTHLTPMLIGMHIDTVILCGCTVGGCVYASSIDSCSNGFRTIAASDGVADRAKETFDMFLWNMGQKYADIMTVDQIIEEINKLKPLTYDLLW